MAPASNSSRLLQFFDSPTIGTEDGLNSPSFELRQTRNQPSTTSLGCEFANATIDVYLLWLNFKSGGGRSIRIQFDHQACLYRVLW